MPRIAEYRHPSFACLHQ